jgi:hypothetical protein
MSANFICNPEELVLENIITIDESALAKNFKIMMQCMNNFKTMADST